MFVVVGMSGYLISAFPDLRRGRDQRREDRIKRLLQNAYGELILGSNEEAIDCFEKILAETPATPEILAGLVCASLDLNQGRRALQTLEEHADLVARSPALGRLMKITREQLGDAQETRESVSGEGRQTTAAELIVVGLSQLRDAHAMVPGALEEAYHSFTQAALMCPEPPELYYYLLAESCHDPRSGRDVAALLASRYPDSIEAQYHRGVALKKVDPEAAVVIYRRVLQKKPDHLGALLNLADLLGQKGARDEAITLYRRSIALRPIPQAHLNLGITLAEEGLLEAAVDEMQLAIRMRLESLARAARTWRTPVERPPELAVYYLNLANALSMKGDVNAAIEAYGEAIRIRPDTLEGHDGLAYVLKRAGRPEEAILALQAAIRLAPTREDLWYRLASSSDRVGRLDEAIAACREAIRIEPEYAAAYSLLGEVLRMQGNLADAIMACERARDLDPSRPSAHASLGRALRAMGSKDEAVAAFRAAVALDPKCWDYHAGLGIVLMEAGFVDEAIAAHRRALELDPSSFESCQNLGAALARKGLLHEAVGFLGEAVLLQPDSAVGHQNLMRVLRQLSRRDAQLAELRRWAEVNATDSEAWHEFAWGLLKIGRRDEELSDPQGAIAAARKAVGLSEGREVRMLRTLALALEMAGEKEEALEVAERGLGVIAGGGEAEGEVRESLEGAVERLGGARKEK